MQTEYMDKCWEDARKYLAIACQAAINETEGIERLKSRWLKGKEWILPHLNDEGRIDISTKVAKDNEAITRDEIMLMVTAAYQSVYATYVKGYNKGKYRDLDSSEFEHILKNILRKFEPEEVINNRMNNAYELNDVTFQAGTKVSKYISTYASFYGWPSELTELIQIYYSNVMNVLNGGAVITLSVNPLDMLFTSCHTSGWTSCHNLFNGGYKTGSLAYMVDNVTAIAFAHTTQRPFRVEDVFEDWRKYKGYDLSDMLPVPVKLWRQMVMFDVKNHSCIHSRQYPSAMPMYEMAARRLSAKVLSEITGSEYKWYVSYANQGNITAKTETPESGIGEYSHQRMGFHYTDPASSRVRLRDGRKPEYTTGTNRLPCVMCGIDRGDTGSCGRLMCKSCAELDSICPVCSRRTSSSRIIYSNLDRVHMCRTCFDAKYIICNQCHRHMRKDKEEYREMDGSTYCKSCYDAVAKECQFCKAIHHQGSMHLYDDVLVCPDCVPKHAFICEYCGEYHLNDHKADVLHQSLCKKCMSEYFAKCSGCGCAIYRRYPAMYIIAGDGKFLCSKCAHATGKSLMFDADKMVWVQEEVLVG